MNLSPYSGGEWDCSSAEALEGDEEDNDGDFVGVGDVDSEDDHDDDKENVDGIGGDFKDLFVTSVKVQVQLQSQAKAIIPALCECNR